MAFARMSWHVRFGSFTALHVLARRPARWSPVFTKFAFARRSAFALDSGRDPIATFDLFSAASSLAVYIAVHIIIRIWEHDASCASALPHARQTPRNIGIGRTDISRPTPILVSNLVQAVCATRGFFNAAQRKMLARCRARCDARHRKTGFPQAHPPWGRCGPAYPFKKAATSSGIDRDAKKPPLRRRVAFSRWSRRGIYYFFGLGGQRLGLTCAMASLQSSEREQKRAFAGAPSGWGHNVWDSVISARCLRPGARSHEGLSLRGVRRDAMRRGRLEGGCMILFPVRVGTDESGRKGRRG